MNKPSRVQCLSADLALAAMVLSGIALVVATLMRPDLNVLQNSLSYYAIGPWGTLQATAFAALGVASIALAIALGSRITPSLSSTLCTLFLIVAGVASLSLVYFPMGGPGSTTVLGDAHQTAGTIGGVAELAATLAFVLAIQADPVWSGLTRAAKAAFAVALTGAVVTQVEIWWPDLNIPMGVAMRLVVVPLLALWIVVAFRLSQTCAAGPSRSVSVTRSRPYSFRRD
jgi:Protein of unknown function (DUF998)